MKKIIALSLALLVFPIVAFASIDTNLYYGVKNQAEVTELQEFLIDKGFLNHASTGSFYSLTLSAVKKYQSSVGLPSTGYVGVLTRKSINDTLLSDLSDSNNEATSENSINQPLISSPISSDQYQSTISTNQPTQANQEIITPIIKPSCTITAINQDTQSDYKVLLTWKTEGIEDGTVGRLFIANRWIGGLPDFDYGNGGGSPILKAPSGSQSNVMQSQDYKAVFGDVSCTAKLSVAEGQ